MSKDAKNKAIEKKRGSYSFLTKGGFRVDAPGGSPKEAHAVARSKMRHYGKHAKLEELRGDKLSGTYFKYNKEGLHANEGPYYQHRPKHYQKGNK